MNNIETFSVEERSHLSDVKREIEEKCASLLKESWWSSKLPWDHTILTGGAIASLIQGETPKDWDVYFLSDKAKNTFVQHLLLYSDQVQDVKERYIERVGKEGKMITGNAITMKNGFSFITMTHGDANQIRKSFDFVHCKPYFYMDKLYISKRQYLAAKNKVLLLNDPGSVPFRWRVDKFKSRGYVIPNDYLSTASSTNSSTKPSGASVFA